MRPKKAYKPTDLNRIRRKLGVTQKEFARLMNMSPRSICEWEAGTRTPKSSHYLLYRVADLYPNIFLDL